MSALIQTFIDRSIEACKEVKRLIDSPRKVDDFISQRVGEGGDQSLLIDIRAEAIFFEHFLPEFAVYSEESGSRGESAYLVVLDPIDGSDNLVSSFPYYGSSMALQHKGETVAAVVCNLVNGELFIRVENSAPYRSYLNNLSVQLPLEINTYAKVGLFEKSSLHTGVIDKLIKNKLKFRGPGAIALSIVYTFSARYMVFIGKERSFDIEAGLFIVGELPIYRENETIIIAHDQAMLEKLKVIVLGERL